MTHDLLALHYAYPITIQTLQHIEQQMTIAELMTYSSSTIAQYLRVSAPRAQSIQQTYERVRQADLYDYYESQHIQPIIYSEAAYPSRLLAIYDAPAVLYTKGDSGLLNAPKAIACIGARQATDYSADVLKQLLPPLIAQQYVVVSGLALGADTLAHRAALYYGGTTIAVLGHGFHTIYPKSNHKLAQIIAEKHLLVTEYAPHFAPRKAHFPQRNRIISGLVDGLIVTESALRSGTMITTELALQQGKDVFVAPGPITSPLSAGTNKLIREGAIPVWNGYQIIEELQMFQTKN